MYAEAYRPTHIDEVFGHTDIKNHLKRYLSSSNFEGAVCLIGSAGIGKTSLVLSAAQTYGFEILELNASRALRSYDDVDKLRDSCRSTVSIASFIRGDTTRRTCVVLDEVDGADPHAQASLIHWFRDPTRRVPILCTGNETPTIFKRHSDIVQILRCFPPSPSDLIALFPHVDIEQLLKECHYDVRRVHHRLQYGTSYTIPTYKLPPTGSPVEMVFRWKQQMFGLPDPFVYRADTPGTECWFQTIAECTPRESDENNGAPPRKRKLRHPDKSHTQSLVQVVQTEVQHQSAPVSGRRQRVQKSSRAPESEC